jgi:hypothetical protein
MFVDFILAENAHPTLSRNNIAAEIQYVVDKPNERSDK